MNEDNGRRHHVHELHYQTHHKYIIVIALIIVSVIVAVLVPLAMGELFTIGKYNSIIVVPWTASDALSYCGAILAAIIAIAGVFFTVITGEKERENQIRDSVAPYFSVIFLDQENKRSPFFSHIVDTEKEKSRAQQNPDGVSEYREVESRIVYAIIGNSITYQRKLNKKQTDTVQSSVVEEEIAEGVRAVVVNPVVFIPLKMRNTGQGTANAVRVGVNHRDDEWSGVCSWTLSPNEDFYLGIYGDTDEPNALGAYEIRIVFYDCLGYQYLQSFELNISKNGGVPQASIAYVGSRKVIDDVERKGYLNSIEDLTTRNKLFK